MIAEKIPLPLPLDIKDAGAAGPSDGFSPEAEGLEACEVLGLPPPPAYEDVHPLSGRSIFRRRSSRNSRVGRTRLSIRTSRAKELPGVPPDASTPAPRKGKEPENIAEENEEGENSGEEVETNEKVSPVDDKPGSILDEDEDESSSVSSSNTGLPLSSPTSIATTPSHTISAPIHPMYIVPRPSVYKKGSTKSSSVVTSEQRAEVRSTVVTFVRDLVTKVTSAHLSANDVKASREATRGILASCSNACRAHNVHFGRILQARCISDHTPLYWAVVNRQPQPRPLDLDDQFSLDETDTSAQTAEDELLYILLAYAGALSPHAMDDLRHACLVVADNVLLQRLRATPAVNPLAEPEAMLLFSSKVNSIGNSGPRGGTAAGIYMGATERYKDGPMFGDCAIVREGRTGGQASENAFRVDVEIDMFQRRMRVVGEIAVEFVARGRLWTLCFFVVRSPSATTTATLPVISAQSNSKKKSDDPSSFLNVSSRIPASARLAAKALKIPEGVWVTALALLPHSAPCGVDARIIIEDPAASYGRSSTSLPSPPSRPVSQLTHNRSESGREHYLTPPPEVSNTMRSSSSPHLREAFRSASSPLPMQSSSVRSRAPSSSSAAVPFVERLIPRTSSRTSTRPPLTLRLNHTKMSSSSTMLVAPSPPLAGTSGPMVSADKITSKTSGTFGEDSDSEWEYEYTADAPGGVRRRTAKSIRRERKAAKKVVKSVGKTVKRLEREKEKAATSNKEVKVKTTKREKALAETVVLASLDENGNGLANGSGKKKGAKGRTGGGGPGGFLMYDHCAYIAPNGTLRLVLEAQLRGPGSGNGTADGGCIIC